MGTHVAMEEGGLWRRELNSGLAFAKSSFWDPGLIIWLLLALEGLHLFEMVEQGCL